MGPDEVQELLQDEGRLGTAVKLKYQTQWDAKKTATVVMRFVKNLVTSFLLFLYIYIYIYIKDRFAVPQTDTDLLEKACNLAHEALRGVVIEVAHVLFREEKVPEEGRVGEGLHYTAHETRVA